VLTETVNSLDATGVGFPTDNLNYWISLGGGGFTILPSSIPSGESFGIPEVINLNQNVSPASMSSEESVGAPTVIENRILQPSSILSLESLGEPVILSGTTITAESISTGEVFGDPKLIYAQIVSINSIPSEESFGIAIIQDGVTLVIPVKDRATYQSIQKYLSGTGKFVSKQNNDIIVEWLKSEGYVSKQFNDLFYEYWDSLGYTGTYNDRWGKWKGE
jgi:hypothetical protein